MKLSSRDLLDILRLYNVAGESNIPRQVEMIKISHPSPINTLASFRFTKRQYYVLLDDTAEDNADYILSQIKSRKGDIQGEILRNPRESKITFGMPFRGKSCHLFAVVSDKKRLDKELATRYPEISRSTWQKYIKSGYVKVNKQVTTSIKYDVADIDDIAVSLPAAPEFDNDELPIIYIDDNVIVINKPTGILTHAKGNATDEFTVADFFKRYTTYNIDTNRPGIVHRLDRDTSGVIIGARNPEAAIILQKQFSDRKAKKTYYAVLDGIPKLDKANIDLPIGRNPSAPSAFRVDSNGKPAQTRYEVIVSGEKYSLVKLQPLTGRTHQLRVHMQYINTPILGDRVYGKPTDRLYLHAYSLEITTPGGSRQTFVAPVPSEIADLFPGAKI